MEKWESSPRKRLRDTRNREQCEKVFPELKRQREAKERVSRTAQRGLDTARSEADIAELCANLEGERNNEINLYLTSFTAKEVTILIERRNNYNYLSIRFVGKVTND